MDSMSSVVSSSTSERSYESPSPKQTGITATVSHDTSKKSNGNSPGGTVSQRHARATPPSLTNREASRSLLPTPRQPEKRDATDVTRQPLIKDRERLKPGQTSTQAAATIGTPPSVSPRGSSLRSPTPDDGKKNEPTLRPKKHSAPNTANSAETGLRNSMHATMRKMALDKNTSVDAMEQIKTLYNSDIYKTMPDKAEIVLGKIKPISSHERTMDENYTYTERVHEFYRFNVDDKANQRMLAQFDKINEFEREEDKLQAGHEVTQFMISKLTPNQRSILRREFPLLYWKATIRDDINWLFFDTVICSSKHDHNGQKEIISDIFETHKGKVKRHRDKITGIKEKEDDVLMQARLKKHDRIMDKAHGKMSVKQRNELKEICKARYDALTDSRLPTLHLLIKRHDNDAMTAYIKNVLRHAPPEDRVRLLLARCDTPKGKETGDASFFSLAYSGNTEMIATYIRIILKTKNLTLAEKYDVLRAVRLDDGTSAFHMMMCAGDWPRVECFTNTIHEIIRSTPDYFEAFTHGERAVIQITLTQTFTNVSMVDMLGSLLHAPKDDHTRDDDFRSAYTSAMESGKKKCAQKFKKLLNSRDTHYLLRDLDRKWATREEPADNSRKPVAERLAARKKADDEFPLYKVRQFISIESRPSKLRDEQLSAVELSRKITLEEIAEREKQYPTLALFSISEHEVLRLTTIAKHQYPKANHTTAWRIKKEMREEKKKARKNSSLLSLSKPVSSPHPNGTPQSNSPASPKTGSPSTGSIKSDSPRSTRLEKYRPVYQHSYPDLPISVEDIRSLTSEPGFSIVPSPSPKAEVPNKPRKSPSSPYRSDQQNLLEVSEGD